jgi:DNA transposition AAA+ family ATPase
MAINNLTKHCAMGVVYGVAGLGKSFAVAHAMANLSVPAHWLDFAKGTTTKQLAKELLYLITGVPHDGTRHALELSLLDALAAERRAIVLDEAERLGYDSIEYLRHLHDRPNTTFALILVGGNGCWELLRRHAMFRSRLLQRVEFKPLPRDEVLKVMRRFHPIYREAKPDVISLIDETWARGNFRNWASFTVTAVDLMQEHDEGTVTQDIVENVLLLKGEG